MDEAEEVENRKRKKDEAEEVGDDERAKVP